MSDSTLPLAAVGDLIVSVGDPVMDIRTAVAAMTVLGHRLRIEIWCILAQHGSSGLSAGAIAKQIAMAPSTVSFHLQQMAEVGALKLRHAGRYSIYSVRTELLSSLCAFLTSMSQGLLPSTSSTS